MRKEISRNLFELQKTLIEAARLLEAIANDIDKLDFDPEPKPETEPIVSPVWKRGSVDEAIKPYQKKLAELGYYRDRIDGIFGKNTEQAVRYFQNEYKMAITGILDGMTQHRILSAEPERPSLGEGGRKELWIPGAEILDINMRTKGSYSNNYPRGAVIHFTAGRSMDGDKDAVSVSKYIAKKGYTTLVISSTGKVFQSFPLDKWGYHAGKAKYDKVGWDVSSNLVGIEICCAGKLSWKDNKYISWFGEEYPLNLVRHNDKEHNIIGGYYHKYTVAQEDALIGLLIWLKHNNPNVFDLDLIVGHDECAVPYGRKNDPGASLSRTMRDFRDHVKSIYNSIKKDA